MTTHNFLFKFDKRKLNYLALNYSAYGFNFISGLILARKLGPENRGVFAFLNNLFLVTLLIAPLNAKNAASLSQAEIRLDNPRKTKPLDLIKVFTISIMVSIILSFSYFLFLENRFEKNLVILFCLANLSNSLASIIQIHEGVMRTKNDLKKLAVLRFLGYASPSILVFALYLVDSVTVENVIFGQVVAMVSCFVVVFFVWKSRANLSSIAFQSNAIKTFPSYLSEYLVNFLPLIMVSVSEEFNYIGYFAIAYGYALIADTYFQILESKLYFQISELNKKRGVISGDELRENVKHLFVSQLFFAPGAFLIPILYGKAYANSTLIALILLAVRFLYSIVKFENILLNAAFRSFRIPMLLNFSYIGVSILLFLVGKFVLNIDHPWVVGIVASSTVMPLVGAKILGSIVEKNAR